MKIKFFVLLFLTLSFALSAQTNSEMYLIFDGINDYVNVGNHDAVNISGSELTLEAWVYNTAWKEFKHQGCVINTESAPNNGYMIRVGANGTVNVNIGNNGWNEMNTPEGTLQLDTWYHLAATFNAGVITLYIDGVEVLTADSSASLTTVGVATSATVIGNWEKGDRGIIGAVQDVRIWNVARSAADIAANMGNKLIGTEAGLAGYWQLDEGEGQLLTDLTGNSLGGTRGSGPDADENDPRWLGEVVIPPLDIQPKEFLQFDGGEQYVDAGNAAELKIAGSALTLEAWVNMKEFREKKHEGSIINKEGGAQVGYMLRSGANHNGDGSNVISFNLGSGSSWEELLSPGDAMSENRWYHVAATFDGTTMALYINGFLVADTTYTEAFTIADTDEPLFIGSSAFNPNRTLNGSLAEIRVWNVVRDHQTIADGMNNRMIGDEAGLVGYWALDEGEGQSAGGAQLGSTPEVDVNDPLWGPVTETRLSDGYLPQFPPVYFQGPFPFGSEKVRFDSPADKNAPSGDGVFTEYTAYRGTPNYDGDDGNLDEDEWNKIPWTLIQFNQEQGQSVYNFDSMIGWTGYADHTAWFKMLHDDDNVYLAIMKVDDIHTWSDEAWDDTFYLWQCDAIQMQFDARAPGVYDDPMPQAEIGLGSIDGEDAYNYWAGGPGDPVINQQLELAPGSSQSSFASVFGKALHTNVGPHPTQEGLLLETIEAAFVKWDDIKSDEDFAMMMSIITLDRDTVGTGRPASDYFTVFEFGQGLFRKNRTDYASLVLSAGDIPVGVEKTNDVIPSQYVLEQNYPNPFNPTTKITYSIPHAGDVKLTVFDLLGRQVAVLVNKDQNAGNYSIDFTASNYASGLYFYQLVSGNKVMTKKMMLLK